LIALLSKHAAAGIPPSGEIPKTLGGYGTKSPRRETQTVLRVSRPEVLEELRKSKGARSWASRSPDTVVIKAGAQSKVWQHSPSLGYWRGYEQANPTRVADLFI